MSEKEAKKTIKSKVIVKKKPTSEILKLKKQFRLMQKAVEKKALSVENDNSNIDSTTGSIYTLDILIVQGNDNFQRVGNQINNKYLQINLWIFLQTTTLSGSGAFDIILDRAPTGTLPVITDIFPTGDPHKLVIWDRKKRFKVLRHHHFVYGTYTTDSLGMVIQDYIKFNNLITQWTGNAGTQADMKNGKNELLLVFRSSQPAAGSLSYGMKSNCRLAFTDS